MAAETPELNLLSASVDALIDGLRTSDLALIDKCMAALCAIGPRVVPLLSVALQEAKTAPHRRRIADAIELIEDTGHAGSDTGRLVYKALLDCLRVSNKQLNEKATEAISLLPGPSIFEIVAEATYHRRKVGYSQRLMMAASRLGLRRPT